MKPKGRILKRVLSLALSLIMVMTILPIETFAVLTMPNTGPNVTSKGGGTTAPVPA